MIENGQIATARAHSMTDDDLLRSDMIERLMCDFRLDLNTLASAHGRSVEELLQMTSDMRTQFHDQMTMRDNIIQLNDHARLIARLCAQKIDAYSMPEGRHSRAL